MPWWPVSSSRTRCAGRPVTTRRGPFGGYCFLNNAAIAAEHTRRAGVGRVAVLDIDYHHGNGTQQIFYDRSDVLYASVHADPDRAYPYFAGFADEHGAGAGRGATSNLPLPAGCDDAAFLATLSQALDAVHRFDPGLVVVSLGVDTYGNDPLGDFAVTEAAYHPAGLAVAALGPTAGRRAGRRLRRESDRTVGARLPPRHCPPHGVRGRRYTT